MIWTKYQWIWMLLAVPLGLAIGFLYLNHIGIVVSSTFIATSMLLGLLGAVGPMSIIYLVKRKLKSSGVNLEEIGDERAELIRQKAAFKAVQCYILLFIISPVFLFFDYKLSVYWSLLISIIVLATFFFGFMLYYSRKLE